MTDFHGIVAIATFRRPDQLHELLVALSAWRDRSDATVRVDFDRFVFDVVVIDNEPGQSTVIPALGQTFPWVQFVHEPRTGIAAVRNRALEVAADRDFLVFIDDDEIPSSRWLESLVETWCDTRPAAVAGRVVSEFRGELDPWIEAGNFFRRRSLPTGTPIEVAATNNLLIDLGQVRSLGLGFADDLGTSGGEDTLFTGTLTRNGARIVWCDDALVTDVVPVGRLTRKWVLDRAFSSGNSAVIVRRRLAASGVERGRVMAESAVSGSARLLTGSARALVGVLTRSPQQHARGSKTRRRGLGMLVGVLGLRYEEYARSGPTQRTRRLVRDRGERVRPLIVLESFPDPRPTTNPYIVMLRDALAGQEGLELLTFSWRRALLGRWDVFHTHWPEILVSGRTPLRSAVRQSLFALVLLRARLLRKPLIRTLHNLDLPSDLGRVQTFLLRTAYHWTTLVVTINATTPPPDGKLHTQILHGHYRDWFQRVGDGIPTPGRLCFVGLIRRYKGVDGLISAFRQLPDEQDLTLRISGQPSNDQLARELTELAGDDPRIHLHFAYLSDAELVAEITASELVTLPYREMHNSGGALAALSLDRPVLVPDNDANRALAREVGEDWVQCYSGSLTGDAIVAATAVARDLRGRPDLGRRDWSNVGADHLAAFRRAVAAINR